MPVVTRSFSTITTTKPTCVEAQTESTTRQTDQAAPSSPGQPHQTQAEPPTPKADKKISPSQALSHRRLNRHNQALYVLGIPIRYFLNVLGEDTQKKLQKNREWADQVLAQEAKNRRLEVEGLASHPLQTTRANAMTPSPGGNEQATTTEMAKASDSDRHLGRTTEVITPDNALDSNIEESMSARPPDVHASSTASVPMPMPFTPSQTTRQHDDQQQSSSPLFFPSPSHSDSTSGPSTKRQLEKRLCASDLLRPAARKKIPKSNPRGPSQPTSTGTCTTPRRKTLDISPRILAMVFSSRSGGGNISTKPAKRLSFERMEQFDRDPLKLAQNNELARAVYQSPDRFPEATTARDAVQMEKKSIKMREHQQREQRREQKEQRRVHLKEMKATRVEERMKEQIARSAGTPKTGDSQQGGRNISKPLNILGLQRVNSGTDYANRSAVDALISSLKPLSRLGRKRRHPNPSSPNTESPSGSKRLRLDSPKPIDPRLLAADAEARSLADINDDGSHNDSSIANPLPIIASNAHVNLNSDATPSFPTTMTPLSALQSLHANLTHLAAQNEKLIHNTPGQSQNQYVPGTPAWARLEIELAAQKRPQTPHIPHISNDTSEDSSQTTADNANLLEKINAFAIEIEIWEADVSARLAAKKQMLYTQLAEEVEGQMLADMQTEQNQQAHV